jgi:hypothetical protein
MAATHLPKGSDLEKSTHADHSGAFTTQRLCVADSAAPQYLAPPADAAAATADAPSFAAPVLRANLTGITEGKATYMVGVRRRTGLSAGCPLANPQTVPPAHGSQRRARA